MKIHIYLGEADIFEIETNPPKTGYGSKTIEISDDLYYKYINLRKEYSMLNDELRSLFKK